MADYRESYPQIRSAGASVVAISVDAPDVSEALRVDLALPFPIFCDTGRRVIQDWGVYNAEEKAGIAKPAVFIIDPSRAVRYAAVDSVVRRVPATEIVSILQSVPEDQSIRRRFHFPLLSEWKKAIRNLSAQGKMKDSNK